MAGRKTATRTKTASTARKRQSAAEEEAIGALVKKAVG
jgi:hypothetical protein